MLSRTAWTPGYGLPSFCGTVTTSRDLCQIHTPLLNCSDTALFGFSLRGHCHLHSPPQAPPPTPQQPWPARTSISVRKWMASGRVTRRFLFRTSFLSFVHLCGQSQSLREVTKCGDRQETSSLGDGGPGRARGADSPASEDTNGFNVAAHGGRGRAARTGCPHS